MKTLLFPLLLAAIAYLPSQVDAQKLFDIGIKGGGSLDDLTSTYQHAAVVGGHVGIFARVKPPILPGAQGEILLTSLGSDMEVEGYSAQVRTLAIQTPVMAVFSLGPAELHAGAYYERYFTEELVRRFDVPVEVGTLALQQLSHDGTGLLLGGGVRLGHFYGGVRYNMGMSSLGSGQYLEDIKSRQWMAYIGIGFMPTP